MFMQFLTTTRTNPESVFDNPNPFKGLIGIVTCLLIKSLCLANYFLYEIEGRYSNSMNELGFFYFFWVQ